MKRIRHIENLRILSRIISKALILFLAINLLWAWMYPVNALGQISAYNTIFPGRKRLPYGDNPQRAYNLSLFNLNAMFASHELAGTPKPEDEFRVILIGDSSAWGYLLPPDQTLSAHLNQANLSLPDGRQIRVYNLGYPVMSLTKDLLILSESIRYKPDLLLWLVTLESFPRDKQIFPPLLQYNPLPVQNLIQDYHLDLNPKDPAFKETTFWDRTIVRARRELADWARLQLYGVMWATTGIDQDIPETFTARQEDLPADPGFHDWLAPPLNPNDLAFDVVQAGVAAAGTIPVLIVNEPMFISRGENSDIRYNYYYPRWAYDQYRQLMQEQSEQHDWRYLDLWDTIPPSEFTNTAIHLSASGTQQFAGILANTILKIASKSK